MESNHFDDLIMDRMSTLVDQASDLALNGHEEEARFMLGEAKALTKAADDIFYMTYHRHLSSSYGVDFEIEHGDPELMFGGA